MKKSLIALAVAGAFAAPAFAATSNVDVYGIMNIAVEDTDATGDGLGLIDNTSRIGFKGAEDLGGGLKAIWQIEQGISATNTANSGVGAATSIASRNTFIGLAGSFGTALMGRHDTPYKLATGSLEPFSDNIGDYNQGRLDGVDLLDGTHDARSASAIAYISPTFNGFHVAAAIVADGTDAGANDTIDATSIAAIYSNGPLFGSLAYQDFDATNNTAWKLGLGYSFGDAKVGFIYEDVDNFTGTSDRDSWQLNGVYNMGPIALKAVYGQVDNGSTNKDEDMWAIGADYSLSKRTTAYFVYGSGDDDAGSDQNGWNIGVKHSF